MKFGKKFEASLSREGTIPQEWVHTAIQYKMLKKTINKVVYELDSVGLNRSVLENLDEDPLTFKFDVVQSEVQPHLLLDQHQHEKIDGLNSAAGFKDMTELEVKAAAYFFNTLFAELQSLLLFKDSVERTIVRKIQDMSSNITTISSPEHNYKDLYTWREILREYGDTRVFMYTIDGSSEESSLDKIKLRLDEFVEKVSKMQLTQQFKHPESSKNYVSFVYFNYEILNLLKFQILNTLALRKILKKFDKHTLLRGQQGFLAEIGPFQNSFVSHSFSGSFFSIIQQKLLTVIPQLDDYLCPICMEIAFKPIRLDCSHLFCVRCLVKLQRERKWECPICRHENAVILASGANMDMDMLEFMAKYFPIEARAKQKQNVNEINKEKFANVHDPKKCSIQ